MNALVVLYGGGLAETAFEPVFPGPAAAGKTAFSLALERAALFPGARKTILLVRDDFTCPEEIRAPDLIRAPEWTKKRLLETLSEVSAGFDLTYYAWADCPLLDPSLAGAVMERHRRYAAEYSYADGWPYGFAPEILSPGTAGILAKLLGDTGGPVERDTLFSVLQRDINAFDIETEISPADLRGHRLSLAADSKRNLLLLTRLVGAGLSGAAGAEKIIAEKPELLRTLPSFYPVQVSGPCPQRCTLCPYPQFGGSVLERTDFLDPPRFGELLDRIAGFSGDAVIDLSLWGELSLHPRKEELIGMVLDRPELSLVVETSGLGWKPAELTALAEKARGAAARKNRMAPLSWIISLDSLDPGRYREIRGAGYEEAAECAGTLRSLFPGDAYVQAVRVRGFEDDIEAFYRSWKEGAPGDQANIIIQKYDSFCGFLPDLRTSDLSPVKRQPCWHLMRDMPVLMDGTVPRCREAVAAGSGDWGNVFTDSLEAVWSRGEKLYREQCTGVYSGICAGCDEYYTYNF
jgi:spiro-SPASM protein